MTKTFRRITSAALALAAIPAPALAQQMDHSGHQLDTLIYPISASRWV